MILSIFIIIFEITCNKFKQELISQRGDIFMGRKYYKNYNIYDVVVANIKRYREATGITQQELADRTGYTHEYIRRIESPNRRGSFTIESVHIISKALDIHISLLFDIKKKSDDITTCQVLTK